MTIESDKKKQGANTVRDERLRELLQIDSQLLSLIRRRGDLLFKEGAWRKSKGFGRIDPNLEKALWAEWENSGRDRDLDPRLLRQLFNLANLFGQERTRASKRKADAYILAPRREPVDVNTPGPRSLVRTRMWAALAAAAGQPVSLGPVILNDPLIEIVKGLNQAGSKLSWTDDLVEGKDGPALDFEEKLIFVGDDPLNFFLLLGLALTGAGRMKFTGGQGLKLLDISGLNRILPKLGARLVALNPHGPGLPARLECGGDIAEEVEIPAHTHPAFAAGLLLAGWLLPQGLTLRLSPDHAGHRLVLDALTVLEQAGIPAAVDGPKIRVASAHPSVPAEPALPLDPVLGAYLLALPLFADGKITVTDIAREGELPASLAELAGLGLDLEHGEGSLTASAVRLPEKNVDMGRLDPALFPLGLALGLRARREITVAAPDDPATQDAASIFLDKISAQYTRTDSGFTITPGELTWTEAWAGADPYFCLACALTAYIRPGIGLENPGELTSLWPQFWNLYNSLPSGQMRPKPVKEKKDEPSSKRRRIKIDR